MAYLLWWREHGGRCEWEFVWGIEYDVAMSGPWRPFLEAPTADVGKAAPAADILGALLLEEERA